MRQHPKFLLGAIACILAIAPPVSAAPLLRPVADSSSRLVGGKAPKGAHKIRWAAAQLNSDALSGSSLEIELPWANGKTFRAVSASAVSANARVAKPFDGTEEGASQWIGNIPDEPYSLVALARGRDNILSGSILLKGQTLAIEHQAADVYLFYEVDQAALPTEHPEPLEAPEHAAVPKQPTNSNARTLKAAMDPAGVADIAVFYTKNARTENGESALQAKIRAAVTASNAVYQASKIQMRIRLAYMGLATGYSIDGPGHDMGQTLQAFADPRDGNMDIAHEVRARYGADAMVLISDDTSFCGLAYIMTDPATFQWPFSVMSASCLPLTFTHELGHNFGMQHDHSQPVVGTPFKPTSFGYRVPGAFSTMMSYPCSNATNCPGCAPCPRIPYFSNPALTPSGASQRIGQAGLADATATLDDPRVLHMAANWGLRRNPGTPAAPTGVSTKWTSSKKIALKWTPSPTNSADGYKIWRKVGGGAYKALLNVYGGKSGLFVDSGATHQGTKYCYKVQAFNFLKTSALSSEVCRLGL